MKSILGIGQLNKKYRPVVAAIGVFDSVHRGHQRVIRLAVEEAKRIRGVSVVITFDPHPASLLHPDRFKSYVLTPEHRLRLIASLGADICLVMKFDKRLSMMSAEDFIKTVLVKKLGVKKVVVGADFHFGHDRKGSVDYLTRKGREFGFAVKAVQSLHYKNITIKTRLIKYFIAQGDLCSIKNFLGRHYSMLSVVKRGDGRGKRFGFPTANLGKENVVILPDGIYCVHVIIDRKRLNGVFYIGQRPTIKKTKRILSLEAHILDCSKDLYGKKIEVEFLKKIREDKRFPDERSLVHQIARDVKRARSFFRK